MAYRFLGLLICFAFSGGCGRARDEQDAGAGTAGRAAHGGGGSKAGRDAVAGQPGGGAGVLAVDGGPVDGGLTPVEGGYCCPIEKTPGCCMAYGGFTKTGGGCAYACDGMPSPSEAWTRGRDAHGCPTWIEPEEFKNCCGCQESDGGVMTRSCDASGTWTIEYTTHEICSPSTNDTIRLSTSASGEDAGQDEVVFESRGPYSSTCGGGGGAVAATHTASVVRSASGCTVQLSSNASWCSGNEMKCEDLELTLHLDSSFARTARVEGTYRQCWCAGAVWGIDKPITGTATRTD